MLRTLPVVVLACAGLLAQRQPPGTTVDGDLGADFDRIVTTSTPDFWGAVLVAVEGRIVLAKGYGFADRQKVPIGPQSLFDLGTTAQQLTTLVALRLVADKKLRLEDPVGKYVDDWPADKAEIKVGNLVRHTSGLPLEAIWDSDAANQSRFAERAIARTVLVDQPGQAEHYSGLNMTLLALVIEEVARQRFDRLLVERVMKPFGMSNAVLWNGRPDQKLLTLRRSAGNERGELPTLYDLNWAHRGAHGVLASVLDVHAMLSGLLAGKLLPAEQLDVLWRPFAGADVGVAELPAYGATFVLVHGQTGGYRARWLVHRARRSWVVVLTQDQGAIEALEGALLAQLAKLCSPEPASAAP
ncbi:MAG: serine hydrolase domain-containing protein, partial [Planctomycetota bacterium]